MSMSRKIEGHSTAEVVLMESYEKLPHPERIVQALSFASTLVEQSAYALAQHQSGGPVVNLILMATRLEETATGVRQQAVA